MKRTAIGVLACLTLLCLSGLAQAKVVRTGRRGYVSPRVFDISFDNMLLLRQNTVSPADSDDSTSTMGLAWSGGITPRFFIIKNLALEASAYYLLEKSSTTVTVGDTETTGEVSDGGLLFMAGASYYVHLAGGMFLAPGLAGGYYMGTRSTPIDGDENKKQETSLSGAAGRVTLYLVYYAGDHLSFRAGPQLLMRFGTEKEEAQEGAEGAAAEEKDGPSFTRIDATFSIGLGYTF